MRLRKRSSRVTSEVATSSLNDIMFFLLLFFLIVSTMVNPSVIKLTLPQAKGEQTVAKKMITLTMTADKQYFIDDVPVTLDQIGPTLQQKVAGVEDPSVVLRVDNALSVQDLVNVVDIGTQLKVKMILATTPVVAQQ